MNAGLDAEAVNIGLLMEAAHTQQKTAANCLKQLRQHAEGLSEVVRVELRDTLATQLRELEHESERAVGGLRALQRAINARSALWSAGIVVATWLAGLTLAWWVMPTPRELHSLKTQRDALEIAVRQLRDAGGRMDLRRCGSEARLCVRIDRRAPSFGADADYRVVKGY